MKKSLVILISGTGTNMLAVIKACKAGAVNADVSAVISSNADALGLKKAADEGIKTYVCALSSYASPIERDAEIMRIAAAHKADYIVLAGYLGIITAEFVKAYPKRIVNIHPSLLPKYGGKGCYGLNVHKKVIENKEGESGATVHFVDEDVDTGQIIQSRSLKVLGDDTPETLQKRILNEIEPFLLVDVLSGLCKD